MRLEPAFDLGFWAFGLILAFRDGMYSIHLGPLALCLVRNLPRVSMQELARALAEQHAAMLDELTQAGVVKRVNVVERLPSSDRTM